jgi:hypothetical protein
LGIYIYREENTVKKLLLLIILPLLTTWMTACANSVVDPIEVTYTGEDCTVIGPTELPAGEHGFIFIDSSGLSGGLYLVRLEEGKTFQDHLDGQSEPGVWYPKPPWVFYDRQLSLESEEVNGDRVDKSIWKLDKVGEHTILCYADSPRLLWFAAPLFIVEE